MAEVVLDKVTKIYPRDIVAVAGMNLTVADGEFVVLLGPSGCGKTTTLRLITGLESASHGTISIGGAVVNDIEPKDRNLAMVFQNYALYPHMTVYKNLAFSLKFNKNDQSSRKLNKKQIDAKVKETAKLLEIQDLLDRKPFELSGGQRQRVALGRALVRQPQAFLFDEPLCNLDVNLRSALRTELRQMHQNLCTTTIYVTHDQEEAMCLADRMVVMHQGIIHQTGSPLEVYEKPVDRFVAGFIGSPPMNFIDGVIRQKPTENVNACDLKTNESEIVFDLAGKDNNYIKDSTPNMQLPLPKSFYSALAPYINKPMVLGIRPEHLLIQQQYDIIIDSNVNDYLHMQVTATETLGSCQDVYLGFGEQGSVIARCESHVPIHNGRCMAVKFDLSRLHVFEPGKLGRNVTLNGMNNRVG